MTKKGFGEIIDKITFLNVIAASSKKSIALSNVAIWCCIQKTQQIKKKSKLKVFHEILPSSRQLK